MRVRIAGAPGPILRIQVLGPGVTARGAFSRDDNALNQPCSQQIMNVDDADGFAPVDHEQRGNA